MYHNRTQNTDTLKLSYNLTTNHISIEMFFLYIYILKACHMSLWWFLEIGLMGEYVVGLIKKMEYNGQWVNGQF